jgi:uncharacterized protein YqgC (DUF456 family)
MPDWLTLFLQVAVETFTLFALFVGLAGLIIPVFPGLVIMWLATLVYALIQNSAGMMTTWDCNQCVNKTENLREIITLDTSLC